MKFLGNVQMSKAKMRKDLDYRSHDFVFEIIKIEEIFIYENGMKKNDLRF